MDDKEVFKGKTFSDLLKDIYSNSYKKKRQINLLVDELKTYITNSNEAMNMVPLVKDYLEVSIKNDELLIKMASVYQKHVASVDRINSTPGGGTGTLTSKEKEELLATINKEIIKDSDIIDDIEVIDRDIEKISNKSNKIVDIEGENVNGND